MKKFTKRKLISEICKRNEVDGIFVHAIEISDVVAEVAAELNLPFVNKDAAINSTDKFLRYVILEKNKIKIPTFALAHNVKESKKIAKDITYPVIIKPRDNAGSRGVILVKNDEEMEKYFDESIKYCKKKKMILVEKYLEGPQVSSETVIFEKSKFTTGFSDRNYKDAQKYQPYIIEDGGDIPSILPNEIKKDAINCIEKTIEALKIDFGSAKGDIVIHDGIPYVIEMATRTSGGRFASDQVPAATGVNILNPLIKMAMGEKISEEELIPKFNRAASTRHVILNAGKIKSIHGIETIKKMPGIYSAYFSNNLKIGHVIPHISADTTKMKVATILATGDFRDLAIKNVDKAKRSIKITMEK